MSSFLAVRRVGLITALLCLLADVVAKKMTLVHLAEGPVSVIDGLFNLRLAFNKGVSFSMFNNADQPIVLFGRSIAPDLYLPVALGALAVAAAVLFTWWMGHERRFIFQIGMGGIVGGAIGNMLDRIQHGAVVDMLDFYYGSWHFPTFNIADSAICVGVALLFLDGLVEYVRDKRIDQRGGHA